MTPRPRPVVRSQQLCPACDGFGSRRCRVIAPITAWGELVCLPDGDTTSPALGRGVGRCDRCKGVGEVEVVIVPTGFAYDPVK